MEYSIYKDSSVEDTVVRIKSLLKDINLPIKDIVNTQNYKGLYVPYSTRVYCFGLYNYGTNGKGTSINNALASGYAEFMERLQNQMINILSLQNDKFQFAPDENIVKIKDIGYFEKYFDSYQTLYNCNLIAEMLHYKRVIDTDEVLVLPFYGMKERDIVDIPIKILLCLQGSNGMCAGNTPEEALVQGLSEIYERYACREVITKGIAMPDIPMKYIEKYEKIMGIKTSIEKSGYKISFKDASLGKGLPVVCTILENINENKFTVQFASQPSLPIAVERTLTEFAQGGNCFTREQVIKTNYHNWEHYINNVLFSLVKRSHFLEYNEYWDKLFFNNTNIKYEFSPLIWCDSEKNYSNKELLDILINKAYPICQNDIYIRDNSFLGFPAYYIFIPEMSYISRKNFDYINKQLTFVKWANYIDDNDLTYKDINQLILALDFKLYYDDKYCSSTSDMQVCDLSAEYLLMLCYIAQNSVDNVIKYADIILKKHIGADNRLIEMILLYFNMKKSNIGESDIYIKLSKEYDSNEVMYLDKFIKNLNFKVIKQLIRVKHIKSFIREEKFNQVSDDNISHQIQKVRSEMIKKYIQNPPEQLSLDKVLF